MATFQLWQFCQNEIKANFRHVHITCATLKVNFLSKAQGGGDKSRKNLNHDSHPGFHKRCESTMA